MRSVRTWFGVWAGCLVCLAAQAPATAAPMVIDRPGAGLPAGWGAQGVRHIWRASAEAGPLGAGAAAIAFQEAGELGLESPVQRLAPGESYALFLWIRASDPEAQIHVALRDNTTETALLFDHRCAVQSAWTEIRLREALSPGFNGPAYLALEIASGAGEVCIDGLWFGAVPEPAPVDWQPPRLPVSLTLRPEAPWGVVNGAEPQRFVVSVAGTAPAGSLLQLHGVHVNGMQEALPAVALESTGQWEQTLTLDGALREPMGMVRVVGKVTGPAGEVLSRADETLLSRAPAPVPGPAPASPFGIHVSLRAPDLAVAARLGYKWCRLHDASGISKWGLIEPAPGEWIWHDEAVDLARQHGFSILGLLDSAPPWASGNPITSGYWSIYHAPRDLAAWRNYVRRIVGHYAGRIDAWEVWNEPWNMNAAGFFAGGNPWKYAGLLKSAYEEAKAVHPGATIVGINTSPAVWDRVVLALGTLPYLDQLSFHRYDAAMPGPPGDGIGAITRRLREEQARYGTPRPLVATEGGPDITAFHGSFHSFADPSIMGDWSTACDQYVRTYLRYIATGVTQFFAYSIHNAPRHHGAPTCMLVEPGYLPSPVHLALAAFAKQVEGMRHVALLVPAPDVSAHVFQTPPAPPATEARTVVVLVSDGEAPEDLPRPLPADISCRDRWGNPAAPPRAATRGPVYLEAQGAQQAELLKALEHGVPEADGVDQPADLTARVIQALTTGTPPLWTLCSAEGSVLLASTPEGARAMRRATLKQDAAAAAVFALPAGTRVLEQHWDAATSAQFGTITLSGGGQTWRMGAIAVDDGPGGTWRFRSLALMPAKPVSAGAREVVEAAMRLWESGMQSGDLAPLAHALHPEVFWSSFTTDLLGTLVWQSRDLQIATLRTAAAWGKPSVSSMELLEIHASDAVAICKGTWRLEGALYDKAPMTFMAALSRVDGGWAVNSFCGAPLQRPKSSWLPAWLRFPRQ